MNNDAQPQNPPVSRPLLAMAAAALAVPALVPLLILIEPRLVPFIAPMDSPSAGTVAFLIGLSLVLLALNWGFLYLLYRWFQQYGRQN